MGLKVEGNFTLREARNVKDLVANGEFSTAVRPPVARDVRDLIAGQLETQEAARKIEERTTIPLDRNRPIFNSLIENKKSSRYILDMMK
jgi:hypothetical protein